MTPTPQQPQQPHEWFCCEDCEHDGQGTCPVPEDAINNTSDLKRFQKVVKVTGCKHQKSIRSRPSSSIKPRPPCEECIYQHNDTRPSPASPEPDCCNPCPSKTANRSCRATCRIFTTTQEAAAQAREELVVELNRQTIGKTRSQILDILCECQANPEKYLESLRTGTQSTKEVER